MQVGGQPLPEDHKYEVIDPDAMVDIRISCGFYNKLQDLLSFMTQQKGEGEMMEIYAQIKKQDINNEETDAFQTLFILLKEFQVKAHEAGFVKQMTKAEIDKMLKEKYPDKYEDIKVEVRDESTGHKTDIDGEEEPAD